MRIGGAADPAQTCERSMHPGLIATILASMKKHAIAAAWSVVLLMTPASWPMIPAGLAMPADDQRPDNLESVRIGRAAARKHCAICHAVGPKGNSPNPRAPRFPLIAERYPNNNPAPDLVDGAVIRHPGMPEFIMTEEETDGLVAYLRNISRKYRRAGQP
jgi:mono/diheme cytochrome c family protein